MNKVWLIGRFTTDPQINQLSSGLLITRATLAVERERSTKNITDFIQITFWNQTANFVNKFIPKGTLVSIEGSINTGSYTNNQGAKVYTTEIVADSVKILEPKSVIDERSRKEGKQPSQSSSRIPNSNVDVTPTFKPTNSSVPHPSELEDEFDRMVDSSDLD